MSENLSAYTVPGEWFEKSVNVDPFKKVVGLRKADGTEVLLPDSPDDYWYGGGYSKGYSLSEVQETVLPLSNSGARQLESFFEDFLIKRRWRDVGQLAERYDCHWLALWLTSQVDENTTADTTLDMADKVILEGDRFVLPVNSERMAVIGGLCMLGATPFAEAYHSFVSLSNTEALQATGMHGAVALTSQEDTLRYYQETSDTHLKISRTDIGVFTRL